MEESIRLRSGLHNLGKLLALGRRQTYLVLLDRHIRIVLSPIEFLRLIATPVYSVVEQPIINRVTAVRKHCWRLPETKTLNDCPYIISYESPRRLSSASMS